MKDEITGIAILFALIGLFVFHSFAINTSTQKLAVQIQKAESKAKPEEFEAVMKKWKKERKAMLYLCTHTGIAEIDEFIELGNEYMEDGNEDRAVLYFRKARLELEDLADREKIKLDNIF